LRQDRKTSSSEAEYDLALRREVGLPYLWIAKVLKVRRPVSGQAQVFRSQGRRERRTA